MKSHIPGEYRCDFYKGEAYHLKPWCPKRAVWETDLGLHACHQHLSFLVKQQAETCTIKRVPKEDR